MDTQPRLESLNRRHAAIEQALQAEEGHAYHDDTRIRALKIEKLHVKEEMARLQMAANSNRERWQN